MRSKTSTYLLVAAVLVLAFLTARGVWTVVAAQTSAKTNSIMTDGGGAQDLRHAVAMFNVQMLRAQKLANTCVYVAACSFQSAEVAKKLVALEIDRDKVTLDKYNIRDEAQNIIDKAREQYKATGKLDVDAIQAELGPLQDKYDAATKRMQEDTHQIYGLFPAVPSSMKSIFEKTF